MTVPDYQSLMLPLLEFAKDGKIHHVREAQDTLAAWFELSEEDLAELLPSGTENKFKNRVSWANTYLKKAKLLYAPMRAHLKITERGQDVLDQNPSEINIRFLNQFPEFLEFHTRKDRLTSETRVSETDELETETPEEQFQSGYEGLRTNLEAELLEQILEVSPQRFEHLVIDLLVRMGYGGSRKDAGRAIGRTHDGGIDGIIKEDFLGLDNIYVQAKRWGNTTVGRPEIQKFAGALQYEGAGKGVFITTSSFSKEAENYANGLQTSKIILIDGERLAGLMVDFNLGVSTQETYEIKQIDFDYFVED